MALRRFTKQFFFGTLFLAVLFGVSVWVWHATRPKPSCFDGVQNQNEQGVDCGGVCALACKKEPAYKAVTVRSTQLLAVGEHIYDVIGEVENENSDFGTPSFAYEFALLDATGTVIMSRQGTSYLMPRERRFMIEQRMETNREAARAMLKTGGTTWIEVAEFPPINLTIRDRTLEPLMENNVRVGTHASGVIVNRTGFDFEQVDVTALVKDENGTLLGVGATDVRILRDGEQRAFEIRWPLLFSTAAKVEMDASTNVLANENFLSRYRKSQERFQQEVPTPSYTAPRRY